MALGDSLNPDASMRPARENTANSFNPDAHHDDHIDPDAHHPGIHNAA